MEPAFIGLDQTTGILQHQMAQQFYHGTALSTYSNNIAQLFCNGKALDVAEAERLANADPGTDPLTLSPLQAVLARAQTKTQDEYLMDAGDGAFMVTTALNEWMTSLLPNMVLQRVKH